MQAGKWGGGRKPTPRWTQRRKEETERKDEKREADRVRQRQREKKGDKKDYARQGKGNQGQTGI